MENHYKIVLRWCPEEECWIAEAPEVKYIAAHGATREEALAELQKVLLAVIQMRQEEGRPLPTPEFAAAD